MTDDQAARPTPDRPVPAAPTIQVKENGPYIVNGLVALRRSRQVMSEQDEPLTWETYERIESRPVVALCRCGASESKPFCDGTHARIGFVGTETAPVDTYDERAKTFEGTHIVMRDDRGICEHAGFCGNHVTNVWEMMEGSATDDTIVRAQVMSMIENCPSGALTFRLEPNGDDVEPELVAGIGVVEDGPLYVTGSLPVERSDGEPFESRNRVTLCRCGASGSKPLCDGSHASSGFRDG
jgi:CDGSH-type Zn-finger protein